VQRHEHAAPKGDETKFIFSPSKNAFNEKYRFELFSAAALVEHRNETKRDWKGEEEKSLSNNVNYAEYFLEIIFAATYHQHPALAAAELLCIRKYAKFMST